MTFARPTLPELRARGAADVAGRLKLGTLLPKSVLLALVSAEAAAAHGLHGHLAWLEDQLFPQTGETTTILRWADLRGVVRIPADFASGSTTISGQAGAVVPVGTALQRSDGTAYKSRVDATIGGGGTVDVLVRCLTAGEIGNSVAGTPLRLSASLPGVSSTATVATGGLVGGVDAESDEDLRLRVLERWRAPARGGSATDWVGWAREVPGVTRAWCVPRVLGRGTVGVLFAMDEADYGPIPTPADVDLVAAHLEPTRPVGADLYVYAPAAVPLDLLIHVQPDTDETRAAIEAAVRDLLRRESEPGGRLLVSHIREAISLATGVLDFVLYQPSSDVVAPGGSLSVWGTPTYL